MRRGLRVFICVSVVFIVFLLSAVGCYEPSSNKATAFNINGHYREIDDAQAREIESGLIDKLVDEGLTNYTVYDSSELTEEILGNRVGKTIIERCFSLVTSKAGDAKILNSADPDFSYISYRSYAEEEIREGTVMLSFMVYNPENNYTDDIEERYDFVLTREFED